MKKKRSGQGKAEARPPVISDAAEQTVGAEQFEKFQEIPSLRVALQKRGKYADKRTEDALVKRGARGILVNLLRYR